MSDNFIVGFLVYLSVFLVCTLSNQFPVAPTFKDNLEIFDKAEDAHEPDPKNLDVFEPGPEWQTLKPGQAVPAGSHVRLNLQTGQREAKLGDEYLSGKKSTQGMHNKEARLFNSQELKQALKKFKALDYTTQKDTEQRTFSSFRSMDELKRDMAMLDVLVETDVQLMNKLLSKFSSTNTTMEQKVTVLLDLEYLVHQVDNAHHLVSVGGIELVNDALNSTDFRLQENAAFVLGSALSSNPYVQVVALERGTLQNLLTMLATPRPMPVKKKVLFALASLLRHFTPAQSQFVKHGGVQVLAELFQTQGAESVRVRIITLLCDMITEKEIHQTDINSPPTHQEHVQKSSDISLFPMLVEQGWCRLVPEILDSPDHDSREKALNTLQAMMPYCQSAYTQNSILIASLGVLQKQYQELALTERNMGENDGYFGEILFLVDSVLVKCTNSTTVKDSDDWISQ